MTVDDTTAKEKAVLSDTQEIPANAVRADLPADMFDDEDEDDVAARLQDASTRRRARRITGILALIAALGLGFYGGVLYQKHQASPSSSSSASSIASAFRAAFAGRGGGGGGAALGGGGLAALGGAGAGTSVAGTVSAVSDGTLYVSQGTSSALVKVVTNPKSSVTTTQSAPLSAVQPGDTVIISGAKQKDGSFMASSIRDSGSSSTGGGGGAASFGG